MKGRTRKQNNALVMGMLTVFFMGSLAYMITGGLEYAEARGRATAIAQAQIIADNPVEVEAQEPQIEPSLDMIPVPGSRLDRLLNPPAPIQAVIQCEWPEINNIIWFFCSADSQGHFDILWQESPDAEPEHIAHDGYNDSIGYPFTTTPGTIIVTFEGRYTNVVTSKTFEVTGTLNNCANNPKCLRI